MSLKNFLFAFFSLTFTALTYGNDYREVSATSEASIRLKPSALSPPLGILTRNQSAVILDTVNSDSNDQNEWFQIFVPEKKTKGWVFSQDVVSFSNPEQYAFRIDRDAAVQFARHDLQDKAPDCTKGKNVDTTYPFVSSAYDPDNKADYSKVVLVSFKQRSGGEKISLYLTPKGKSYQTALSFCSQGVTDQYEIDDLKEWATKSH